MLAAILASLGFVDIPGGEAPAMAAGSDPIVGRFIAAPPI
jgi:hypothetical protein